MGILRRLIEKTKHIFRKTPEVHILSDSHGEAFKYVNWSVFNLEPSYCIMQGATASGLANPNSKTKALPIFLNYLNKKVKKIDTIIFQLGEIDCGFTIWLRAEKKGLKINEQLNYTLDNYFKLLAVANKTTKNPIIVTSAIPPTIEDGQNFGEIANLRKEVKASLFERTKLTSSFNGKLKEICELNNHLFVDFDEILINKDTQLVDLYYKNTNKLDHHLDPSKLGEVIENKLVNIL